MKKSLIVMAFIASSVLGLSTCFGMNQPQEGQAVQPPPLPLPPYQQPDANPDQLAQAEQARTAFQAAFARLSPAQQRASERQSGVVILTHQSGYLVAFNAHFKENWGQYTSPFLAKVKNFAIGAFVGSCVLAIAGYSSVWVTNKIFLAPVAAMFK